MMCFGIIRDMQGNLQIPCGIFDFKRIRTEGFSAVEKPVTNIFR